MEIVDTVEIDAPVERVWGLTIDVEAWPQHSSTFTHIERLEAGELTVGSTARVKQPAQRSRVWTVTALEPRHRFAWATSVMGATMTGSHELVETNTGTTNTLRVDIDGAFAPLIAALVRRPIRKAIGVENQGFKTAAESLPVDDADR